jgi:hypothetical protein
LFLKKILKNIAKVITFALVIVVFVTLVWLLSGMYGGVFVTSWSATVFMVLIIVSLVIRSETV